MEVLVGSSFGSSYRRLFSFLLFSELDELEGDEDLIEFPPKFADIYE